jgi:Protein of unknown function (DUF1153)
MNPDRNQTFADLCVSHMNTDQLKSTLLGYISPASNRWTAQRKVAALTLVRTRLLAEEELCRTYGVGQGELAAWGRNFDERGIEGLMATKLKPRRRTPRR